ncbi:hypothetical protein J5N97_022919 [Dioscorea zingiberensis]|uniref:Uncharacterized protein n=1 Tax=Dioscorea zingiberensis TaxID=325984 RepID=A0A9D5CBC8_9LILI|nr:hypothetical protein J5N97_022919 [Dioscorea zingiberensis]
MGKGSANVLLFPDQGLRGRRSHGPPGPLGWPVPKAGVPFEIRRRAPTPPPRNLLWTFIVAQLFLMALCHLKFGLFFFFAALVLLMTVYIFLFLPETKNVPIEEMNLVWKKHWFWGKYITDHDHQIGYSMRPMVAFSVKSFISLLHGYRFLRSSIDPRRGSSYRR